MRKRLLFVLINCLTVLSLWAVELHIANPQTWTSSELAPYVGQTVSFDVPMFLLYASSTTLSPSCLAGSGNTVSLSGAPKSTRARTFSRNLQAKVRQSGNSYYLQYVSGTFDGNTRETLLKGPDSLQIDAKGKHDLLVCTTNLEYYLTINVGQGFGPGSAAEHKKQREKVKQALSLINADIYGLCEIEQGTAAVQEICDDLNSAHPNRNYLFVNNGTSSSAGTYTTCMFVYDAKRVHPIEKLEKTQTGVNNRKYMMYFIDNTTDEGFIFSLNHFKSKSGGGDTESDRIEEAYAVNALYKSYKTYCHEEDLLIMGDLNVYAGEKPVTILLDDSTRTDLHTYFHPEGSYSYLYGSATGYLDHAIVNSTMLGQVTGMQAFHVNSDEKDCYTYDGSCNDGSMFRYSDHDPIVVGLHLSQVGTDVLKILNIGENLCVQKGEGGYIRIYDMSGNLLYQHAINSDNFTVFSNEEVPLMGHGCYVVHVFHNGVNHVTKFIRP